jgi:hypothetical protein
MEFTRSHLIPKTTSKSEGGTAYLSIGQLIISLSRYISKADGLVVDVMEVIREGLVKPETAKEALFCLSLVLRNNDYAFKHVTFFFVDAIF